MYHMNTVIEPNIEANLMTIDSHISDEEVLSSNFSYVGSTLVEHLLMMVLQGQGAQSMMTSGYCD